MSASKENTDDRSKRQVQARLVYINDKLEGDAEELSKEERSQLQSEAKTLTELLATAPPAGAAATAPGEYVAMMPCVKIDPGVHKYVLIEVTVDGHTHHFVRGNRKAKYHYECAADTLEHLSTVGLTGTVQGGGRIRYDPAKQEVEIYGFSYQYGLGKHSTAAALVQSQFGPSFNVTFGDHGY